MEHYVTLFDSLFLPQGLALHRSMERHLDKFTLWILCVDEEAFDTLSSLRLQNLRLMRLADYETAELKSVKRERTRGEYCWTLTPFAPGFVFATDSLVDRVTYLDADLWFLKHPKPLFDEFEGSQKDVLITEHAYSPDCDMSAISGRFCVQFMIFNRNGSETVLDWWGARCLEWCYARAEDGKFGDQKYLDDWPERFADSVHILQQEHFGLAPWNAQRYPYGSAIFYHFHELRICSGTELDPGGYSLPRPLIENVYYPYARDIRAVASSMASVGTEIRIQVNPSGGLRRLYSKLTQAYRFIKRNTAVSTLRW